MREGPSALFDRALACRQAGDLDTAIDLCRQLLDTHPSHVETRHLLGALFLQRGEPRRALDVLGPLADEAPSPGVWLHLATAWQLAGEAERAGAIYRRLSEEAPELPEAHFGLGATTIHHRPAEALVALRRAVELRAEWPQALDLLGVAAIRCGDLESARDAFERATDVAPGWFQPHHNLGELATRAGEPSAAIAAYDRALERAPGSARSRLNRAYCLLQVGRWREGWAEHEWRFGQAETPRREGWDAPVWRGEPLDGETVVVWTEQGLGDGIQFARFATSIAERGGTVHLQAAPPTSRLLATTPGVAEVFTDRPPGRVDFQVPLMSLPHLLDLDDEVATVTRYLHPPVPLPEAVASVFASMPTRPRIGVVWRSGTTKPDHRRRDLDDDVLRGLIESTDAAWFGLQFGTPPPVDVGLVDLSPHLGDFATTAAIVDQLDLVVTVDTAMAHLAGALGKKVWVLLAEPADWRWLSGRDDTPWYPSMRLFRQRVWDDWRDPVGRIVEALGDFD